MNPLPRDFYSRPVTTVATELLGKCLVRRIDGHILTGTIMETEAYGHSEDPASHAHRKMTQRNRAMFGETGRAYVYFTYGMHYCFNVVARHSTQAAGAVLIRAIQPQTGVSVMMSNRNRQISKGLTDGPAKLTKALSIDKKQYGHDLTQQSDLYIADAPPINSDIVAGPRIGVRDTREWNFRIATVHTHA